MKNLSQGERGQFFQVDRRVMERVYACGLNSTVAYLILSCGTGRNNRTTTWSTHAIEKYTGLGRDRAKRAIDELRAAQLVRTEMTSASAQAHPRHELLAASDIKSIKCKPGTDPDWIWLPNSIVTGAKNEKPPVERLRCQQDIRVLRMFLELYYAQSLADDGGSHWKAIRRQYARHQITERGQYVLWGFTEKTDSAFLDQPFAAPFITKARSESQKTLEKSDLWNAWRVLNNQGLVERVEHLIEADTDEASIIHACSCETGTELERALGNAACDYAEWQLQNYSAIHDKYSTILPVSRDYPKAELVGIYRLTYRPKTQRTAAWIAKQREEYGTLAANFINLTNPESAA